MYWIKIVNFLLSMIIFFLFARELKNKETGIDISIPVYKEIKGLLNSSWEFYVVVVSCLPYFKSPKHKDTDVVQFMVCILQITET